MRLVKTVVVAAAIGSIWSIVALSQTALQGGDNINNAFPIGNIPYSDNGTTIGYANDYAGNCGHDTGAPDVVYSYTPPDNMLIMMMLCLNSNFDTRLYVFEDNPSNIIACNDDNCSNQYSENVSMIECLEIFAGHTYYFVIDGYGSASGDYSFDLTLPPPNVMLSGYVTEFGDGPVSGATIRVLQYGQPIWQDTTIASGQYYVIYLDPGIYTVEASKSGYISQTSDPVFVDICDPASVDFALQREGPPPIGSISGFVTETDNITPIEGAIVEATWQEGPLVLSDTTDSQGAYAVNDLQLGLYDVEASKDLYQTQIQHDIEVFADQSTPVDFILQRSLCPYRPGDVNGSGVFNGLDVTYMVGFFKGGPPPPIDCHPYCPNEPDPFYAAGDVNGDCVFNGLDIMYFVIYLKGWAPSILFCPDCPPGN